MRVLVGLVAFITIVSSSLACDFANPHSFSCQNKTFNGEIFSLFSMRPAILNQNWWASQFTPAENSEVRIFQTMHSSTVRHRTCGVLNRDGTRVGNLRVLFDRNGISGVTMPNFRRTNFITDLRPRFEDAFSFVFGNERGRNVFRCRIFDRVNIPHLTCQYFRDNIFMGYLGFLPKRESCN